MKITCKYQVLFGQVQVQVQVLWHFHSPSTQVHQVLRNMYLEQVPSTSTVLDSNPAWKVKANATPMVQMMEKNTKISILLVESKIIENVMHTQIMDYFTLNKLFTSQQYGCRAIRSTEFAALELMDRNIDNMNRNLTPVNVYIDLSKAFDCLDHNILLSKLKFYGLSDDTIRLLKNYLSDREQYVQLGNIKSQLHGISRGIPQGSVMAISCLIFLLMVKAK